MFFVDVVFCCVCCVFVCVLFCFVDLVLDCACCCFVICVFAFVFV